jgi:hypothetical protein
LPAVATVLLFGVGTTTSALHGRDRTRRSHLP